MKGDEISKDGRRIRGMFARISPTYDFLNHLLSLNADRAWRRAAVRLLAPRPGERILDLCTGTGDLALAIARGQEVARGGEAATQEEGLVVGTDFCPEMVSLGERKRRRAAGAGKRLRLGVADSLHLPFPDRTFDAAAVAFGIRNVVDLEAGLREIHRVLRPSGRVAILEFSTPPWRWFRAVFGFYFRRVLPLIGRLFASGGEEGGSAYSYLPASVGSFPDAEALARLMGGAGFSTVRYRRLSLGIAVIHLARRPGGAPPESGGLPRGDAALVLEPESPRPLAEIGTILAGRLGLPKSDGVARVRYGGGVLLKDVSAEAADSLAAELAAAGIRARRVEAALLAGPHRVRRARSLAFTSGDLLMQLAGGGELRVARGGLAAVHLYALPERPLRDGESSPTGAPAETHRRPFTIFRRSSRRSRHPPASNFPALEAFLSSASPLESSTGRQPPAAGLYLSPRGRKLREALLAAGDPPPRFSVTLFLRDGSRPVRVSPEDLDYSTLGDRKLPYSLDNFLLLLDDLLAFAAGAWLADRLEGFLARLDPSEVLYFKPEEGQNLEQWMQLWIRLSPRET